MIDVVFAPGIRADLTDLGAEGGWIDCDKIRFRDGLPENIGPWQKFIPDQLVGVPSAGLIWSELTGTKVLAVATQSKLYIYRGGELYNITPLRDSGALGADPFSTQINGTEVTVTHAAHGVALGDGVKFSGASVVNGLDMNGEWQVARVLTPNTYTIEHTSQATGTSSGGGAAVAYEYEIPAGRSNTIFGFGFGAGAFGEETYGDARSTSSLPLDLRVCYLEAWGEDLLFLHSGGSLYHWDATNGPSTRAQLVANAPTDNIAMTVSPDDRHVILYGAGGDPIAVASCNQGDFTDWTISVASTAMLRRLLSGSAITARVSTKGEHLIWTDANSLHGLQYTGASDFSFSLRTISEETSIIGAKAAVDANGVVFWMGKGQFYMYDGRVRSIPCTVLRNVFESIDLTQSDKVFASYSDQFDEVVWDWPSIDGDGSNDRYVGFSLKDGAWFTGTMNRSCRISRTLFQNPLACSPDGYIYEHEIADAADQVVTVTTKTRKDNNATQVVKGPYTMTPTTRGTRRNRARGRQMALRFEGTFTANDETQTWFIESGDFDIAAGGNSMLVTRWYPDIKWQDRVRIGKFRYDIKQKGPR